MAENDQTSSAAPRRPTTGAATGEPPAGWTPSPEAKASATRFRIIAAVLWALAIAGEAVGIFWLLRQREFVDEGGRLLRDPDTGLLEEQGATAQFPQWAFIALLVLLVVIAALSIVGSILWKKANTLDPARRADKTRFFVQNQLGAIIAVVAFLPLVILIFLNKDMDKGQKATAGIVGIVLAVLAAVVGTSFAPPSVEQYTADQSAVIQLLGADEVVWVDGGKVYHVCDEVPALQTGSEIRTGTTSEAIEAGKIRLTLQFASELRTCGLAVPENADEITEALRAIQAGQVDTPLPAPVWADPTDAPIQIQDAPAEAG